MPSSTELIEMAHTEWKNREERRELHDEVSWESGWISGYLSRPHTPAPEQPRPPCEECRYQERIDAAERKARAATLAAQNRGALIDLGITQGMLYEFCEWFCEHDCEESPCKITVSYLHERMEGIKKQMSEHPEYLAKWEKMRDEQKALRQQAGEQG